MLVTQDHTLAVNRQAWNLKARRPWKRSDITDKMVVAAYAESQTDLDAEIGEAKRYQQLFGTNNPKRRHVPYPYERLCAVLGCPEKVAYSAMERAYDRGLIEYGVSLRTGWITDKGIALFQ